MKVTCPHCNQHIAISNEDLGTIVDCPTCQQAMKLPGLPADAPSSTASEVCSSGVDQPPIPSLSTWAGARGLSAIAFGLWAELFFRLEPFLAKFLGSPVQSESLIQKLSWTQIGIIFGAVCRVAGLSVGVAAPAKGQPRTWLILALLLELFFLASAITSMVAMFATEDPLPDGPGSAFGMLGLLANYASAILLILFLQRVSPEVFQGTSPLARPSVRFPAVLGIATLIELGFAFMPTLEPVEDGASSTPRLLLIGVVGISLIAMTLGRYFWLFSFGKSLWRISRASHPAETVVKSR